jgi:hypothetical protein
MKTHEIRRIIVMIMPIVMLGACITTNSKPEDLEGFGSSLQTGDKTPQKTREPAAWKA